MSRNAALELRVLADLLREERLQQELSQENAGAAGGLARKTFGQVERGDSSPLFETVVSSIRGVGRRPADFLRAYADRLDAAESGG